MKRLNPTFTIATFTLALFMGLFAACAALTPHSFDQSLAIGYATQTSVLTTTTQLLQRKQIKKADAERVLAISDQAGKALDAALEAKNAGDITTAQAQLDLGTKILDQISVYLTTRSKKS